MQLTGKWFYNWTKGLICKYEKEEKTLVLGNHKVYSRAHNYQQVDTEGYTEAFYLLTHNERQESLGHIIIITGISLNIQTASTHSWQSIFFPVKTNSAWQQVKSDVSKSVSAPASGAAQAKVKVPHLHLYMCLHPINGVSLINETAAAAKSQYDFGASSKWGQAI